jgi:hypothetical protein
MLEYFIKTLDDKEVMVKIKLLDNDFVNAWKTYLKFVLSKAATDWHVVGCMNNTRYKTDEQIKECLARLLISYKTFQDNLMGDHEEDIKTIRSLLDNPDNLTQEDLNKWHRHFTDFVKQYHPINYLVPTKESPDIISRRIHDVNQYVHQLEGATYYKTTRRMAMGPVMQYAIQFTNANHPDDNKDDVWTYLHKIEPGQFDWEKDSYDHTVWLNEDILGKDQMKAWLDGDLLTYSDVTGNLEMTPSIMLDPNRAFSRIINNTEFQIESKASGKTLDRFPVGDILNDDISDWDTILGGTVLEIKLDNETIWKN